MNLNKREKILAAGVGVVAALFLGQSFVGGIQKAFNAKTELVDNLEKQKADQALQMTAGTIAKQKLKKVSARSLPNDEEKARADYSEWLIQLAEESGLLEPNSSFVGEVNEKDVFQSLKFTITGIGSIQDATTLLYKFYSKDYLHRITLFEVRPITSANSPPNRMNITLHTEVLSLKSANPNQKPPVLASNRITKPLDDYLKVIIERNVFSTPNHPPEFENQRTVEAIKGVRLDYAVDAKDVDPGQSVKYELVGDAPKGLELSSDTGKLTWTASELGEYKVNVMAKDSGVPSRSMTKALTIKVSEPPPAVKEPPKFDIASQAFVSALITGNNRVPEAWIRSKTDSKTIYLRKGDKLKLGDVVGQVEEVGANYLEMETEGKRWLVGLDESLADAFVRSQTD